MPADIVDVERASTRRDQIRPLQPHGGLGKGVAGTEDDAAALAQLAEQRRQSDGSSDATPTIAATFKPVAWRQQAGLPNRTPPRGRALSIALYGDAG